MRSKLWLWVLLMQAGQYAKAQRPDELLSRWSARSPIEKVYLHLDRDEYIAGETIWFKAYLYSEYFPDTISTTLYVELLNASSVPVSGKIVPVLFGTAYGQFELPDSLNTGSWFIRAYSPTMLNQDMEFLYQRKIFIYGKKNTDLVKPLLPKIELDFFPEGGNFISGMLNTIAIKATNEYGLPADVSGSIKNEKGEEILSFSSLHDGMGYFDISTKAGEKYYAELSNDKNKTKYLLPETTDNGIVFRVMPDPPGKYFDILQRINNPAFEAAYMIGQMQHHVVFRQDLPQKKDWVTGTINTRNLSSGILQVTVFNKEGIPLAERLTFVDNDEYRLAAELVTDTLNFSPKAKNKFTLLLKDTVPGSFSVAVTDADYDLRSFREENILSHLLLTSDLKGYIHNPAYYFSSGDDSVKNALDLVMMTNGWRRFKWTELLKNPFPPLRYKDPGYITITGQITLRDSKKPLTDKGLIVMVSSFDSLRNSIQMMATDKEGRFRLDSLIFYDKASILISDTRGRKSHWLDVYPDADAVSQTFALPAIDLQKFPVMKMVDSTAVQALQSKLAFDYDAILKANGRMLEGVTVKARKKNPVRELEEKYASGLFSGFSERTIDLVNSGEAIYQRNIFDYLKSRVPGLNVVNEGLDYEIYYRQGRGQMTLYLDEMETDAGMISTIPANQVAMVKVFSNFAGAAGNGPGGALAVYTKKGSDLSGTIASSADLFSYKGYSVSKEFYSPDYSVDSNRLREHDDRITLHWQPDIIINTPGTRVPLVFYNNDRSRSFKIIIEGMTLDGKMFFIEKKFSAPDQKPF